MYKGGRDLSFEEARKLIEFYGIADDGEAGAQKIERKGETPEDWGISLVPEIDLGFSMGGGTVLEQYEQRGMVPFKADWLRGLYSGSLSQLVVARGEGDSMQPTILDGDIVLIDTSQNSIRAQDRIWAVAYGDLGMPAAILLA